MDRWGGGTGALAALLAVAALAGLGWVLGEAGALLLFAVPFVAPAAYRIGADWGWRRRARRALDRVPRLAPR